MGSRTESLKEKYRGKMRKWGWLKLEHQAIAGQVAQEILDNERRRWNLEHGGQSQSEFKKLHIDPECRVVQEDAGTGNIFVEWPEYVGWMTVPVAVLRCLTHQVASEKFRSGW